MTKKKKKGTTAIAKRNHPDSVVKEEEAEVIPPSTALSKKESGPSSIVKAAAQRLLADAESEMENRHAQVVARAGESSVEFGLDNEEEYQAAILLQQEGYGRLSKKARRGAEQICKTHNSTPYPCQSQKQGGGFELAQQCEFIFDPADLEWVFEYTGHPRNAHRGEGALSWGVLRPGLLGDD